eukprot:760162-Hanusia_phi.AAC.3
MPSRPFLKESWSLIDKVKFSPQTMQLGSPSTRHESGSSSFVSKCRVVRWSKSFFSIRFKETFTACSVKNTI